MAVSVQGAQPLRGLPAWGRNLACIGACILLFALSISLPLMTSGCLLGCLGLLLWRPHMDLREWGLIIALGLWLVFSQWLNQVTAYSWGTAYTLLALPLLRCTARQAGWPRRLASCAAIGALIACALALTQVFWGYDQAQRPWRLGSWGEAPRFDRVSGFFSMHLTMGYALASLALLSLLPAAALQVAPWLWWTFRLFSLLGLFFSQARSAIIGLFAGLAVRILFMRRLRSLLLLPPLLLLAVLLFWLINPGLVSRQQGRDNPRWTIWAISTQIAAEHWLLGSGERQAFAQGYQSLLQERLPERALTWDPSQAEALFARWPELAEHPPLNRALEMWQRHQDPALRARFEEHMQHHFGLVTGNAAFFPEGAPHPHNSILGLIALHGSPAALLWLLLIAHCVQRAWVWRRRHPQAAALVGSALSLALIAGIFEHYAGDSEAGFALWAVSGLGLGLLEGSGSSHAAGLPAAAG